MTALRASFERDVGPKKRLAIPKSTEKLDLREAGAQRGYCDEARATASQAHRTDGGPSNDALDNLPVARAARRWIIARATH